MNIVLVGCGTLGSSICYAMILKSRDYKISSLTIIDNDILECKNLPYIFVTEDNHPELIGLSKVLALKWILNRINPKLRITSIDDDYENVDLSGNSLIIDSRDTPHKSSVFKYKFNIDNMYGRVIVNPRNGGSAVSHKRGNYIIGNSHYYSMMYAFMVCEGFIFNNVYDSDKNEREFVISLQRGKFDEI